MKKKCCALGALFLLCLTLFSFASPAVFAEEGEGEQTKKNYALSVDTVGGGSVVVLVDGTEQTGTTLEVTEGVSVEIRATAPEGKHFDVWDAYQGTLPDEKARTNPLTFIMPAEPLGLRAVFAETKSSYRVTVRQNEYGRANFATKQFAPGEEVKLEATPYTGYRFIRWMDEGDTLYLPDEVMKGQTLTFTMPQRDVILSLEFDYVTYHFKVEIDGEGKVEVEGKEPDEKGLYSCTIHEDITLLATPEDEYVFVRWTSADGIEFSDVDQLGTSFSCHAGDFTVKAVFASSVKNLTITATEGGKVTPVEDTVRFGVDSIYDLRAVPDDGYVFLRWECSAQSGKFADVNKAVTTFTMPPEDCIVTAVFGKGSYALKLSSSAGGSVEGTEGSYEKGTVLALRAIPMKGYVFSRWESSVDDVLLAQETSPDVQVRIPGEDVKLTAIFILEAAAGHGGEDDTDFEEEGGFPWLATILIFFVSLAVVAVVFIREKFGLSLGYLAKKYFRISRS
ncbi:MAG: hypothetical protein IJC84_05790 [Clostridia bacterium]|nr:hypothetical protein [Clostridia bacterium]